MRCRPALALPVLLVLAACQPGGDAAPTAAARWADPTVPRVPAMRDEAPTDGAPITWLRFCQRNPSRHLCAAPPARVRLDRAGWETLVAVQRQVNRGVVQRPDPVGVGDEWTILAPGEAGDCEDIALTKRDILIHDHGWPAGALRPAICYAHGQRRGGPALHAVLTVDTDAGTFVLGNLTDSVAPIDGSECRDWVMRSAGADWVWIAGGARTPLYPVGTFTRR